MKFWKWTKNLKDAENDLRILQIDGVIDYWRIYEGDEVTIPQEFKEELNAGDGDILIYLNSPGGNTYAAAEIYSMLKEYTGGKITVRIVALAASAATLIAMAADTIEVSPLAFMCIHNPYLAGVTGEEKDMLAAAKYLAEVKENSINVYEQKTKLPRETISALMDDETYMNAKKAVELHFADKIIYEDDEKFEVGEMTAEMYSRKQEVNSLLKSFNSRQSSKHAKPSGESSRATTNNKMVDKNFYKQFAENC